MLIGHVTPFTNKSENQTELFFEFLTLVVNYHMMMFTDFVPDVNTREWVGKSLVIVASASLLYNLLFVFTPSFV